MSDANKAVALKFLEALGNGDAEAIKTVLSDDLVAVATGSGVASGSRNYAEVIDVVKMFSKVTETGLNPTILTVTAEDDRVVVEWEGNCTLVNGAQYDNQYVHVFFVRDGRIHELREYCDTALTNEVLGPFMGSTSG